jgi:hypothetical protein
MAAAVILKLGERLWFVISELGMLFLVCIAICIKIGL